MPSLMHFCAVAPSASKSNAKFSQEEKPLNTVVIFYLRSTITIMLRTFLLSLTIIGISFFMVTDLLSQLFLGRLYIQILVRLFLSIYLLWANQRILVAVLLVNLHVFHKYFLSKTTFLKIE